ncbi:MAG: response regulator [Campylobacterota bacterium]
MYNELKNKTILYVEDDIQIQEQTCSLLKVVFKEVIQALDGQEGLEKFEKYHKDIDAVITDINMPNMSGTDMIKKINEQYDMKDIPIIGVSAYSDDDLVLKNESKELFISYLRKPIEIKSLLDEIQKALDLNEVD